MIAAGDDRMDYSMILPGHDAGFDVYLGIVVSNATRDLLEKLTDKDHGRQLYQAQRPCLAGVIEGLVEAMQRLVPSPE